MKTRIPATVLLVVTLIAYGREQKDEPAVEFKRVSLDETMAQLRLYPSDSYLQYVAMILARDIGDSPMSCAEAATHDPNANSRRIKGRTSIHLTRIRRINLQMHVKMKIHGQILFSTGLSRFPSLGEPYVPDR